MAGEWVPEAERAWSGLDADSSKKHVVVDLRGVTFVDHAGEKLLEKLYAAGGILFGSDPMIGALIDEIRSRVPQQGKRRNVASLPMLLLLSFLLATVLVGCAMVR